MTAAVAPDAELAGPFVRAALLCERVLCETDDALSAIRILHEVVHGGGALHVVFLLMLIRGDAPPGSRPAALELRGPHDELVSHQAIALALDDGGPEQASSLVIDVSFVPSGPGVYWFRVSWGEEARLLTKVPLTVTAPSVGLPAPARGAERDAPR